MDALSVMPRGVARALELLRAAGFEALPVGGCVRDLLMGRVPRDWDIATAARPDELTTVFAARRVVETGLRHGTLTVLLEGEAVEITSFRADGGYTDGRHPDAVRFSRSLSEDLARRDFTVNALCLDAAGAVVDRFGGLEDLRAGIIRCVGDPARRFEEDALRILRALRLSAQLGFLIEEATAAALRRLSGRLALLSAERIFSELRRLLVAPGCAEVLMAYPEALTEVLPELAPMRGLRQREDYHRFDVYEHTARAVGAAPPDLTLRLALLLHDVGKPLRADGQGRFHGHDDAGEPLADRALRRLRCPNALRERVVALVRLHHLPLGPDRALLRRRLARLGEPLLRDLLAVQRADASALRPEIAVRRVADLDRAARALDALCAEQPPLTLSALAVGGRDILALGVPPGPAVGRILNALLTAVVAERLPNRREDLLEEAARLLR